MILNSKSEFIPGETPIPYAAQVFKLIELLPN